MARAKPQLLDLPIEKLVPGRFQPRKHFEQSQLQELADSIKSAGILQPIVIRAISDTQYEIVAGERRWRAAQLTGMAEVPCLLNQFDDEQAAEATAIENVIRVDLNPIEEAHAYQRLIDDFGYIHDEVAAAVGKSRVKVTNALRLLKLDRLVQEYLILGKLNEGHGKALAALPAANQILLSQKAVARNWSVRKIEQEVKKLQQLQTHDSRRKNADLRAVEAALAEHIGSAVRIDFDALDGKGNVQIDFHSLDILQGILKKMDFEYES